MTTPGLRVGRYEVGERLGKGGFGVVHLARDIELGRDVAIKFLRPEFMSRMQVVTRFLQEARACAKIGHPGIVTVFEAGLVSGTGQRIDGTAFIVMERLHGESLGDRLEKRGRLAALAAIGIARQLAAALQVAHAAGIIHRDLKPDNVYLVRDAAVVGGERVKILDFGVAKLADPDGESDVHTHTNMMLGTPRYMSPEQARAAGKVDHRTDIYALGCLLYELVCGKPPFGGDIGDVIVQHQTVPITPPSELVANLPNALDELIVRMLAKDPDGRPDSMTAVDEALDGVFGSIAPTRKKPKTNQPIQSEDDKTTRKIRPEQLAMVHTPLPTPTSEAPTIVRPLPLAMRLSPLTRIAIGVGAALTSGLIVYLLLRRGTPAQTVARADAAPDLAGGIDAPDVDRLVVTCKTAQVDKKWPELDTCGHELAKFRADEGTQFTQRATAEALAEVKLRGITTALVASDLKSASGFLSEIPDTSVYRKQADAAIAAVMGPILDGLVAELDRYAGAHDCGRHAARLKAVETRYGVKLADEGRLVARPCGKPVVVTSSTSPLPTPLDACDPDAVSTEEKRGNAAIDNGSFAAAMQSFDKIFKCRPGVLPKLYMSACRSKNYIKAKHYFQQLPEARKAQYAQICINQGYDPRGEE